MATTPVFLPRKSHGQRSLAGYSLLGRKESDTTEHVRVCVCVCVYTREAKFYYMQIVII